MAPIQGLLHHNSGFHWLGNAARVLDGIGGSRRSCVVESLDKVALGRARNRLLLIAGGIGSQGGDRLPASIDAVTGFILRVISPFQSKGIPPITNEIADEKGVEENEVLEAYALLLETEPMRVCHNVKFDEKFLDQMFQRNLPKLSDYGRSRYYLESTLFCTMHNKLIREWCGAKNVNGHLKAPNLKELYKKLFGETFENEHDAMADTRATKRCFFELIKRGVIEI